MADCLSDQRLELIVKDSSRFNRMAGVTGVLVFDRSRFIQYFEGPEDGVASVYDRVLHSTSHKEIVELARGRVDQRQFPYWSMRQIPLDQLPLESLAGADWSSLYRSSSETIIKSYGVDLLGQIVAPHLSVA